MKKIRIEATVVTADEWHEMTAISEGEAMGSMTDLSIGRNILLFGWQPGEGPGVWRSVGGFDYTLGELRGVNASEGLELLSDLKEPYERIVRPESGGMYKVRWTLT